jgi:hypothetical protein
MHQPPSRDDLLDGPRPLGPGDEIHFQVHLSVPATLMRSQIGEPGTTLTVTQELLDLNRDRNGRSWLIDLIDDPGEQVRRYGRVRVARGPAPTSSLPVPGTVAWVDAARRAYADAWDLRDPAERRVALAQARATYGGLAP